MLGDKIKQLRQELNITQEKLAQELSIAPSTIGMYEQNRREPDLKTIELLATYFNVSTDYLLGKSNMRNPELELENFKKNLLNDKEFTDKYVPPTDEERKLLNDLKKVWLKEIEESKKK